MPKIRFGRQLLLVRLSDLSEPKQRKPHTSGPAAGFGVSVRDTCA